MVFGMAWSFVCRNDRESTLGLFCSTTCELGLCIYISCLAIWHLFRLFKWIYYNFSRGSTLLGLRKKSDNTIQVKFDNNYQTVALKNYCGVKHVSTTEVVSDYYDDKDELAKTGEGSCRECDSVKVVDEFLDSHSDIAELDRVENVMVSDHYGKTDELAQIGEGPCRKCDFVKVVEEILDSRSDIEELDGFEGGGIEKEGFLVGFNGGNLMDFNEEEDVQEGSLIEERFNGSCTEIDFHEIESFVEVGDTNNASICPGELGFFQEKECFVEGLSIETCHDLGNGLSKSGSPANAEEVADNQAFNGTSKNCLDAEESIIVKPQVLDDTLDSYIDTHYSLQESSDHIVGENTIVEDNNMEDLVSECEGYPWYWGAPVSVGEITEEDIINENEDELVSEESRGLVHLYGKACIERDNVNLSSDVLDQNIKTSLVDSFSNSLDVEDRNTEFNGGFDSGNECINANAVVQATPKAQLDCWLSEDFDKFAVVEENGLIDMGSENPCDEGYGWYWGTAMAVVEETGDKEEGCMSETENSLVYTASSGKGDKIDLSSAVQDQNREIALSTSNANENLEFKGDSTMRESIIEAFKVVSSSQDRSIGCLAKSVESQDSNPIQGFEEGLFCTEVIEKEAIDFPCQSSGGSTKCVNALQVSCPVREVQAKMSQNESSEKGNVTPSLLISDEGSSVITGSALLDQIHELVEGVCKAESVQSSNIVISSGVGHGSDVIGSLVQELKKDILESQSKENGKSDPFSCVLKDSMVEAAKSKCANFVEDFETKVAASRGIDGGDLSNIGMFSATHQELKTEISNMEILESTDVHVSPPSMNTTLDTECQDWNSVQQFKEVASHYQSMDYGNVSQCYQKGEVNLKLCESSVDLNEIQDSKPEISESKNIESGKADVSLYDVDANAAMGKIPSSSNYFKEAKICQTQILNSNCTDLPFMLLERDATIDAVSPNGMEDFLSGISGTDRMEFDFSHPLHLLDEFAMISLVSQNLDSKAEVVKPESHESAVIDLPSQLGEIPSSAAIPDEYEAEIFNTVSMLNEHPSSDKDEFHENEAGFLNAINMSNGDIYSPSSENNKFHGGEQGISNAASMVNGNGSSVQDAFLEESVIKVVSMVDGNEAFNSDEVHEQEAESAKISSIENVNVVSCNVETREWKQGISESMSIENNKGSFAENEMEKWGGWNSNTVAIKSADGYLVNNDDKVHGWQAWISNTPSMRSVHGLFDNHEIHELVAGISDTGSFNDKIWSSDNNENFEAEARLPDTASMNNGDESSYNDEVHELEAGISDNASMSNSMGSSHNDDIHKWKPEISNTESIVSGTQPSHNGNINTTPTAVFSNTNEIQNIRSEICESTPLSDSKTRNKVEICEFRGPSLVQTKADASWEGSTRHRKSSAEKTLFELRLSSAESLREDECNEEEVDEILQLRLEELIADMRATRTKKKDEAHALTDELRKSIDREDMEALIRNIRSSGYGKSHENADSLPQIPIVSFTSDETSSPKSFGSDLRNTTSKGSDCPSISSEDYLDRHLRHRESMEPLSIESLYQKYIEKMQHFDLLIYEQMYALDLVQPRELRKSKSQKFVSTLTRISSRKERTVDDISEKLKMDELEQIYISQICLTWEVLQWQYKKVQEMLCSGSAEATLSYHHCEEKFQHFQIGMQRFIENEPYQRGTRCQLYIQNRCQLPLLMHVPHVQASIMESETTEDGRVIEEYEEQIPVTIRDLARTMEDAILTFKYFLKSDKKKPFKVSDISFRHIQLMDPSDMSHLKALKKIVQKKLSALHDLKRRKRHFGRTKSYLRNQDSIEVLEGLIDTMLVCRVLKMARLDKAHILWCTEKLSGINVANGKVERDCLPVFFPDA